MGLSLRPLGRKLVDVFSADTEEDQRKRMEAGQARFYADQQRAMGNQRPATNFGAALAKPLTDAAVGIQQGVSRSPAAQGIKYLTASLTGNRQARSNAAQRFGSAVERVLTVPEPSVKVGDKLVPNPEFTDYAINLAGGAGALKAVKPKVTAKGAVPVGAETVQKGLPKVSAKEPAPTSATISPTQPIGTKQRGFVTSVKQSPEVSPETSKAIQGSYKVRSTKDLQTQAEKFASGGLKKAKSDLDTRLNVPEGRITDREVADTIALAKRFDGKGSFEDASNLYEKLAAHLTKQGQSVQAASLLARRTPEGLRYHAQKLLKKSGVELDEGRQKQLQGLVEKVRKTKPDTEARDRAVYDVTKYVNDRIPSSVGDKITNLWRAGLLTAPTTTLGNITGNLGEAIVRKGFVNPVATAADAAMSLVTGKRTQTLAPIGSGIEGAVKGVKELPDFLRTGYDKRNILSKYDAKAINYGDSPAGKAASAYVNGVYRLMGTADHPFYYAAHQNALGSIAKAEAINTKIPTAQRAQFVQNFMDNPPKEALQRANQEAAYAVFQNKTGLGEAAQAFKKGLNKVTPGLGDFVVPFTQVPASIAARVIMRTPIGTAVELVKQFKRVHAGGKFDQRAMAQAIGEGAFGMAVLGAGYTLANSGLLTFGYPRDQKERKLWETEGKQPYSIRIGDRWYSFNYLQPFGTILAVGARAGEQIESGKSVLDALGVAAGTAGQSIANQSFIKGVSAAIDTATDPEREATKFLNQTGASVVPNIVRATARSFDPLQREPAGFVEGIKQGIPGLREQTVAKNDIFGEPLPAKDTPANQLLNPLRPSRARGTDVVLQEVRRLQDMDLGKIPSQIRKDSFGKDVTLTGEQVKELQANVGAGVKQAWSQVVETPEYAGLPDEQKSKVLDRISRDVLAVEKYKYAELNGLELPEDLTAKQSAIMDGIFDPSSYTVPPKPKVSQKKTRKKVTARRASGGRRSVAKGSPRSAGSPFKYAISSNAGQSAPRVAFKSVRRIPVRSKLKGAGSKVASKPKVTLKKNTA